MHDYVEDNISERILLTITGSSVLIREEYNLKRLHFLFNLFSILFITCTIIRHRNIGGMDGMKSIICEMMCYEKTINFFLVIFLF